MSREPLSHLVQFKKRWFFPQLQTRIGSLILLLVRNAETAAILRQLPGIIATEAHAYETAKILGVLPEQLGKEWNHVAGDGPTCYVVVVNSKAELRMVRTALTDAMYAPASFAIRTLEDAGHFRPITETEGIAAAETYFGCAS